MQLIFDKYRRKKIKMNERDDNILRKNNKRNSIENYQVHNSRIRPIDKFLRCSCNDKYNSDENNSVWITLELIQCEWWIKGRMKTRKISRTMEDVINFFGRRMQDAQISFGWSIFFIWWNAEFVLSPLEDKVVPNYIG